MKATELPEPVGKIEKDGHVLVVRRIHVTYQLQLRPEQREVAERVHGFHADACPIYRTACPGMRARGTQTATTMVANHGLGRDAPLHFRETLPTPDNSHSQARAEILTGLAARVIWSTIAFTYVQS